MACGTPVLASNTTALAEVVGSAGLLVDPNDVADISRGITRLANDPEIVSTLTACGLQRAKMWRWSSVGLRIAGALGAVLKGRLKQ
jgi:glycosyltransferase involved in cell wall biosynthesis